MPRSMMEAMASGLPCIASKIRGNVDLLVEGKGGYLVPAKDAELVAECLRELINNKSLRKYMGNENLSRIKEFEVSIVKRIKEIYEEVIGESVKWKSNVFNNSTYLLRWKYLKDCLDSIRNQTFKNFEAILVDDGSPDECPEICDYYSQIDGRLKVIHKKTVE